MSSFIEALLSPGGVLLVVFIVVSGVVCVVAAWIEPCGDVIEVNGRQLVCHRHRWHRGWHEDKHSFWLRPKQREDDRRGRR